MDAIRWPTPDFPWVVVGLVFANSGNLAEGIHGATWGCRDRLLAGELERTHPGGAGPLAAASASDPGMNTPHPVR
jgi:hypothetical protein